MSDYIPYDVLWQILAKLPVKSLLRFRCVSKSCCALIKNPDFIKAHLVEAKNNNSNHQILLRSYFDGRSRDFWCLNHDNDVQKKYCEPKEFPWDLEVMGACNGLICLSNAFSETNDDYCTIIWNPAIKKFVTLPTPTVRFDNSSPLMQFMAFAYNSRSNDYKVVSAINFESRSEVEVFALGTGSWRSIDVNMSHYDMYVPVFKQRAFANGAIHLVAFRRDCKRVMIVALDMSDDVLQEIMLPPNGRDLRIEILACEESLCLLLYDDYENVQIWVMQEYGVVESWTKQYTINLHRTLWRNVLCFWKNGEILLRWLGTNREELTSYDPKTQTLNYFQISQYGQVHLPLYAHVENLVLL